MKILVLGAAGIIGQQMRLCVAEGVEPVWVRSHEDPLHRGVDLSDLNAANGFLLSEMPDAVINLAGENRPDVVESKPERFYPVNVELAPFLARWCQMFSRHYVHVSTQAVFEGTRAPYHEKSQRNPVNAYGKQKLEAEQRIEQIGSGWTIVRPTFVLGVRPMPAIGRENPVEQMLRNEDQRQVTDHWFSISFAQDVARELWKIAMGDPQMRPIHIGHGTYSRYDLAVCANTENSNRIAPVWNSSFPGIAPRPLNTTYAPHDGQRTEYGLKAGLQVCREQLQSRESIGIQQRARELSIFTGKREEDCLAKLQTGFGALHNEVAVDFRKANPKTDDELLDWYRTTEAYCWELSAYHSDAGVPPPGFNYSGMCKGVAERLKAAGAKTVLCLGDGIGDLTLMLLRAGFDAVYHDLAGSRTAEFAKMRIWMYTGKEAPTALSESFLPYIVPAYYDFDAVVSLDFMEHLPNVEQWISTIKGVLKPGGLFCAQNAFNCGSGETGSIPMHLVCNDHFEKDWDPLLFGMGFKQESSNWYVNEIADKPVMAEVAGN